MHFVYVMHLFGGMKNQNLPAEEARIRRLLAAGCPVPTENHCAGAPGLVVEVHKPERTQAFDFRSSTEYILVVRITNNSYARLKMKTIEGDLLWEDENFTWLGDCRRYMPEKKAYRMPSGREISYELVLNHCIREMELAPGESREGILLAWSMDTRIPTDYLHDETFPMYIALLDQFGRSHGSVIEVRVDRSATMRIPDPTKVYGGGLYAGGEQEILGAHIPGSAKRKACKRSSSSHRREPSGERQYPAPVAPDDLTVQEAQD
jgi:hypothetical protein